MQFSVGWWGSNRFNIALHLLKVHLAMKGFETNKQQKKDGSWVSQSITNFHDHNIR